MFVLFRPLDLLLRRLRLERKVSVMLALCMLVAVVVAAGVSVVGVVAYNKFAAAGRFASLSESLSRISEAHLATLKRDVQTLVADSGLREQLDVMDAGSLTGDAYETAQIRILRRLARYGIGRGQLLVAYDSDGEPVAYLDTRTGHNAQGRYASGLLHQGRSVEQPLLEDDGIAAADAMPRHELRLPSPDLQWRVVQGLVMQVASMPVYVDARESRRRVGWVTVFAQDAANDFEEEVSRLGFSMHWLRSPDEGLIGPEAPANGGILPLAAHLSMDDDSGDAPGSFENASYLGRVFTLTTGAEEDPLRIVLLLEKAPQRVRMMLALMASVLVPLLASLVALVVARRMARRHLVLPIQGLADDIDAVRDGRYARLDPANEAVVTEQDELSHLKQVLGELSEELGRRDREAWIWSSVFRETRKAIFVTDPDGNVLFINEAFKRVTGQSEAEVVNQPVGFLRSGLHDEAFCAAIWDVLRKEKHWAGEVMDLKPDGTSYPQWLSLSAITDRDCVITHYAGIVSDITERKANEERINYLAHHDPLTGLPNRAMLMDRVRMAIAHAQREQHQVGVIMLDLDRFKLINDSLGHSVGDGLLETVAERLKRAVRASDTVSRIGGDEFVILLYKLRSPQDAVRVAEHVLGVMAPTARIQGHELAVTPSMGIAVYPEDGIDADELVRNADVAMYRAKSMGRNNFQVFDASFSETAGESLSLEHALRSAVDRDEFELYYQPQIEIATRRLIGVEALIRWNSDTLGMVPPSKFIRIAEECGLIIQMGDWILREACRQRAEWNLDGISPFPIAVNVSALQFRQAEFVRRVEEAMQLYGIPATQLELELTESIVMHESEQTTAALAKLKSMGIGMSVDDFGTGYSSLAYLKKLPINKLKVDATFVRGLEEDVADRAIVEAIISLGRALGLTLVAEGVEERSKIALLGKLGCHAAQGYYYCRPLPPKDFVAWYNEFCGQGKRVMPKLA